MENFAFQNENGSDFWPGRRSTAKRRQESILLIEDNEEAMWLVHCALEEYGADRYRLQWATDLRNGISQLRNGDIDLVLLDLGLPDSSGVESFAGVRAAFPKVPVMVLTGNQSEETKLALQASGVHDYVTKDEVSGSHLVQRISSVSFANKQRHDQQNMA